MEDRTQRRLARSARAETARLFLAAWPAPEIQHSLGALARALQRECGGRAVPSRNIHLTLVFLGNVTRGRQARIESLAATVAAPRLELSVDRVEYWRHNRIVWAGVGECPAALSGLVAGLEGALVAEGFRFERRPYVPHVTLLRNARRAPAAAVTPAIAWPVERYALVESVQKEGGRVYVVRREWPLVG